jgi:serine/threonine protein kinase
MNLFTEIVINSNTYVITDKKIAEGSFGYIKFGKKKGDSSDNLAFKFLKRDNKTELEYKSDFDDETIFFDELTKKISEGCKKYIVELKDYGKVNNEYIIVMEKPDGFISIAQYIENNKDVYIAYDHQTAYETEIKPIYENLLKGIYCINSSGFTYCDIKPANVMVHPDTKEIKYIDFGGLIQDGKVCQTHTIGYSVTYFTSDVNRYFMNDEAYYNGASDLFAIGEIVKKLLNIYDKNVEKMVTSPIHIIIIGSDDFKEKVMQLQEFYRSTCDDEYIEIGELKEDEKEIFFVNKNGYKTFIRETTGNIKEQLSKSGFSELYYYQ